MVKNSPTAGGPVAGTTIVLASTTDQLALSENERNKVLKSGFILGVVTTPLKPTATTV